MQPWRATTRLLSIIAILGLVPFTVPAVAGGMGVPMAGAGSQMDPTSAGPEATMAEVPCGIPAGYEEGECDRRFQGIGWPLHMCSLSRTWPRFHS